MLSIFCSINPSTLFCLSNLPTCGCYCRHQTPLEGEGRAKGWICCPFSPFIRKGKPCPETSRTFLLTHLCSVHSCKRGGAHCQLCLPPFGYLAKEEDRHVKGVCHTCYWLHCLGSKGGDNQVYNRLCDSGFVFSDLPQ